VGNLCHQSHIDVSRLFDLDLPQQDKGSEQIAVKAVKYYGDEA